MFEIAFPAAPLAAKPPRKLAPSPPAAPAIKASFAFASPYLEISLVRDNATPSPNPAFPRLCCRSEIRPSA